MPDEAVTLGVVVARLDDLRTDMRAMREEVRKGQETSVSRGEWGQRNAHVDSRLDGQGREIGDLRTELRSRRLPWPSVAAAIVSIAALGLTITQAMGGA